MYRVGAPSFSNTISLAYPLTKKIVPNDFNFTFNEPTHINRLLDEDKIDIGLISSFHYLLHKNRYKTFSSFGIGASEKVLSVSLFTKKNIKDLHKKTILVPTSSATSINLLKILAKLYWEIDIECLEINTKTMPKNEDFLLIGDESLRFENEFKYPYFDLAKEWYEFTGKKFIFALFATSLEKKFDVDAFSEKIDKALYWSENHRDSIVEEIYERLKLPKATIMSYLNLIQHRLSDEHFEGLELFYHYLLKTKIIYEV